MQMFERYYELTREISYKNEKDQLHREDGPAIIKYHRYDNLRMEEIYYKNGLRHREDGPALIRYYYNYFVGKKEEFYFINDIIHREDGPAFIKYDKANRPVYEMYIKNGKPHREDGPNVINIYYDKEKIDYKIFIYENEDGRLHSINEDTPSFYLSNGNQTDYHYNGSLHRIKGPASRCINEDEKEEVEFYIFGKKIDKKYFYILKRRLRNFIKNS
jgi:hypothetical protein